MRGIESCSAVWNVASVNRQTGNLSTLFVVVPQAKRNENRADLPLKKMTEKLLHIFQNYSCLSLGFKINIFIDIVMSLKSLVLSCNFFILKDMFVLFLFQILFILRPSAHLYAPKNKVT